MREELKKYLQGEEFVGIVADEIADIVEDTGAPIDQIENDGLIMGCAATAELFTDEAFRIDEIVDALHSDRDFAAEIFGQARTEAASFLQEKLDEEEAELREMEEEEAEMDAIEAEYEAEEAANEAEWLEEIEKEEE